MHCSTVAEEYAVRAMAEVRSTPQCSVLPGGAAQLVITGGTYRSYDVRLHMDISADQPIRFNGNPQLKQIVLIPKESWEASDDELVAIRLDAEPEQDQVVALVEIKWEVTKGDEIPQRKCAFDDGSFNVEVGTPT